ncbi:hypothetical protein JAAARDRAFT_190648 [Jaapia argillacea MUCL 33604]|uniref:G-patch domain-containing protein n=1 Tax=Jaapia argillacea MUCL 33604 TaxID=933084 RepID=A0A067Q4Q4_9AGAM|nr:hypothetical protein JAAARDRAFT_190648 [Jaapia argillacea MUCL 33604]
MHSSRLKRKLNDLGVDTSSNKANESFCLIGTPLPPLEKSRDTGEFVPLWKQDVRDEKGRRRLHGAFTGGFSAGYFNTVGSKEGWAPSTFVSSRSDRAKQKSARPEDFMDEEDLAELADSRKLVDENEEMDLLGGTQAEINRRAGGGEVEKDSMAFKLEEALLSTPTDSAGARILRKMGWRPGQGIGPRLTWRQRKLQDLRAATGPPPKSSSNELVDGDEEEDEEAKKHMFPPRDTPVLLAPRKENSHGLGYVPGMGLNESLGVKAGEGKGPRLSSGFGLGALNDAEDDDVDVYDVDSSHKRTRMAYDIIDRDDDEHVSVGSRQHGVKFAVSGRDRPPPQTSSTFRDGKPALRGFLVSETPISEDRWFPLPDIPKGWKPDPRRVWAKDKENREKVDLATKKPHEKMTHAQWKAGVTPDQRGTILGETPLPSAPKSIFEFISQKDRERLKNITTNLSHPSASTSSLPPPLPPAPTVTALDPQVAQLALRGFQPFTTDPVKQSRYTTFLRSSAEPDAPLPQLKALPNQSEHDFQKEIEDYKKAAFVFKPLSGAMAGRFTSSATVEFSTKATEGLHTPKFEPETKPSGGEEEEKKVEEEDVSPKAHAARMGLYGSMTRDVTSWYPHRLLCKRFGIKDPHPDGPVMTSTTSGGVPTANASAHHPSVNWTPEAAMADLAGFDPTATGSTTPHGTFLPPRAVSPSGGGSGRGRRDLSNVGLGEDESQGVDTLTYERPPMDIFKAIFASDEEGSDDDDDGKEEKETKDVTPVASTSTLTGPSKGDPVPVPVPAHLHSGPPITATYNPVPSSSTTKPVVPETIDLATFKPTFIPRSERTSKASKGKEKNKKDKKKSGKAALSFDVEEGSDSGMAIQPREKDKDKERSKKKRKEKKKGEEGDADDEGMWEEKPPPEVVKVFENVAAVESDTGRMVGDAHEAGPPRGRKRAIDFM